MLFSSFSFLFWFLPATLLLYFAPMALPSVRRGEGAAARRALSYQNGVLLVASLVFYAWGEPLYLFLMVGVILADTALGLLVAREKWARPTLWVAVILHISLLFYYKYAAFFAPVVGLFIKSPRLPLGISFYTFQSLTYVVDVYRGEVKPLKNPFLLGVYVVLFPQLVAGPIVRYKDVNEALRSRRHTVEGAATGARRFAAGLAKKMLLANPMGALFSLLIARGASLSALGAWGALFAFAFQIYFDFSGYSDMAVGLGRVFGFDFPENFNYPYISKSITDFWRRWHMTLSSFFREYVYIPLGGNRRGVARTILNLFVVWSLTGLWHGASWNFLLWGIYYFVLLVVEKYVIRRFFRPVSGVISHTVALFFILLGWAIFAFDGSTPSLTFPALGVFLARLLGAGGFLTRADAYDLVRHLSLFALCALGATPLPRALYRKTVSKKWGLGAQVALPLAALLLAVVDLSSAGFNPFLYFRF